MARRQHTAPVLLNSANERALEPERLVHTPFDENALQALLAKHPELLPVREIEPACEHLVFVGREVSTRAGPIDLLYVTPSGNLVVVETKLWRNAESRRTVVAQLLDYAKELASWSFDELDERVAKATGARLLDLARKAATENNGDFDELEFTDALSHNLRACRMLLIIAGDSIRENVEELTKLLQSSSSRRFTLALVELPVFKLPSSDKLLITPRVVVQTTEVIRAVVELRHVSPEQVSVLPVTSEDNLAAGKRTTLTEEDFLSALERLSPEIKTATESLLSRFREIGCHLQWRQSGVSVRVEAPSDSDKYLTLLVITRNATCYLGWLDRAERRGYEPSLARDYQRRLEALGLKYNWVTSSGNEAPLASVVRRADELVAAATGFIDALRKADASRDE